MEIIKKTHEKSWFVWFEPNSPYGQDVMCKNSKIIILQLTVIEKLVFAELITKSDYEE
ncbi:MAG: hypothetical protein ACK5LF_21780 [Bacteroides xylanisolvens]